MNDEQIERELAHELDDSISPLAKYAGCTAALVYLVLAWVAIAWVAVWIARHV